MPEIHIEISCDGDGFPSAHELAMRREIQDALETAEVGEIVDTGGGMGVMDIYLEVTDAEVALSQAKAIVKRLGLADRTTVAAAAELDD
jgi:hypothetical protein